MKPILIHEDKISLLRRAFGVVFLSTATLITVMLLDHFQCTFGVFNDSCGQVAAGMKPPTNQNIFDTPLPIGIFFVTVLTFCGLFFGFFHGRQTVFKGHLHVERCLFGFCFNRGSMANLSLYGRLTALLHHRVHCPNDSLIAWVDIS